MDASSTRGGTIVTAGRSSPKACSRCATTPRAKRRSMGTTRTSQPPSYMPEQYRARAGTSPSSLAITRCKRVGLASSTRPWGAKRTAAPNSLHPSGRPRLSVSTSMASGVTSSSTPTRCRRPHSSPPSGRRGGPCMASTGWTSVATESFWPGTRRTAIRATRPCPCSNGPAHRPCPSPLRRVRRRRPSMCRMSPTDRVWRAWSRLRPSGSEWWRWSTAPPVSARATTLALRGTRWSAHRCRYKAPGTSSVSWARFQSRPMAQRSSRYPRGRLSTSRS